MTGSSIERVRDIADLLRFAVHKSRFVVAREQVAVMGEELVKRKRCDIVRGFETKICKNRQGTVGWRDLVQPVQILQCIARAVSVASGYPFKNCIGVADQEGRNRRRA